MSGIKKSSLFFLTGIAIIISCNQSAYKKENITYSTQKIHSKVHYKISIPNDYIIKEYTGPDFWESTLTDKDSTLKRLGFINIYFGYHPERIRSNYKEKLIKDSIKTGSLLGEKIIWTIYQYENHITGESILNVGDHFKIRAYSNASNYSNLDSLIKIIESLDSIPKKGI